MRRKLTDKLSAQASESGGVSPLGWAKALPIPSRIALFVVGVVVLVALFAPLIAADPLASGTPVQPPSGEHLFGTDAIGRGIFARVANGARASLLIGLCATGIALVAAAVLGSIAATAHKAIAEVLMRILDVIMSLPGIALAAVFVAVFGSSLPVLIGAIAFLYTPQLTRVVRAGVLAQFGEDYVAASRVMGAGTAWILIRHVARNCIAPILVFATVLVADAIVFEASLSFINAGVRPPSPSWGNVLADGKELLLSGYWWPTFFPGLMILVTVLGLNVLSEGLTDAMLSPKSRRRVKIDDQLEAVPGPSGSEQARETELDREATDAIPDGADEVARDGQGLAGPAPAGPAPEVGSDALPDPALREIPLAERLASLRIAEERRDDRLVYTDDSAPLLEVKNLSIAFPEAHGEVDIVDDVSFDVRPGETMGLVGESGCGKSITSMAVMGLLPRSARLSGEINFDGQNLLTMSPEQHNSLRGHEMAMIYQDALSSLNPSMLIRSQIAQLTKRGGTRKAENLLDLVGLDPSRTLKSYPHELSGGQRQRVLIAMALTRDPKLVMADEPTTALDVTVQKQVVDLLNRLRAELGFAMVFVSHDLALVAQLAHRITVMYAGQVVETGRTTELLTDPRHEYTRGLLGSVLSIEAGSSRLHQVPGVVPSPRDFVAGDRFSPRSSRPEVGRDAKAVLRHLDGSEHRYATHPELEATR